ncbi:outer membrane lipid asymmetry maintenance protein MlaD [Thiorhodococcus minor]|uniref:Outer membrane lipid asymmetry maintenance protein MlaD n=1 Tax=Thiorhodococcus minor TaxID=57489 RepID=A0A6M0K402_9GAMM|nr:outer membrane lipid asymmetry maintenance protein MlaD [Thiorhodococcus minor]NEV63075.1 outer membrane lipid asymmetry maintenance protein MlaD [Thiorhodococcus minor]
MAKRQNVELMVGAFVALGLVALFFLAMKVSNLSLSSGGEGYALTARFANVGSLKVRAPVTMAGVRIGRVEGVRFDKTTYEAVVTMRVDAGIDAIPEDTFANIFTAGLLGEQYIGLEPGGSPDYLRDGDEIANTQSALVLEQMIGQFLFRKAGESG